MIATDESVADILNFVRNMFKLIVSRENIIVKFSLDQRVSFCIYFFFRLLNGNKLRAIPDGAFRNLKYLKYMYVSHLAYFPTFFLFFLFFFL